MFDQMRRASAFLFLCRGAGLLVRVGGSGRRIVEVDAMVAGLTISLVVAVGVCLGERIVFAQQKTKASGAVLFCL